MLQLNSSLLVIMPEKEGTLTLDIHGKLKHRDITPLKFLQERCLQNGCSLEGREEAFRYLTNHIQKSPVLVNESPELWFPTLSKMNQDCMWVNWYRVIDVKAVTNNECVVSFDGGYDIRLNCSIRTCQKQLERCLLFIKKLQENKEQN